MSDTGHKCPPGRCNFKAYPMMPDQDGPRDIYDRPINWIEARLAPPVNSTPAKRLHQLKLFLIHTHTAHFGAESWGREQRALLRAGQPTDVDAAAAELFAKDKEEANATT